MMDIGYRTIIELDMYDIDTRNEQKNQIDVTLIKGKSKTISIVDYHCRACHPTIRYVETFRSLSA